MAKENFNDWFETFLEEKNLGFRMFEIEDDHGYIHLIDSDLVIENIKHAPDQEKEKIKIVLVKIDFYNGNVHHFFKHLAKALVAKNVQEAMKGNVL